MRSAFSRTATRTRPGGRADEREAGEQADGEEDEGDGVARAVGGEVERPEARGRRGRG